jgi:two-component system chemotaxis response regulator CheY
MTDSYAVLLAEPDQRLRALLANQLAPMGCEILQAPDGNTAFEAIKAHPVRVVVTELYLRTGEDDDLIHAIRRVRDLRLTRALALTQFNRASDRDWAMRAGADAYLIKPTRAERLRYVIARLAASRWTHVPATSTASIVRRDSLEAALLDLENGVLKGSSSIIFARTWWEQLTATRQTSFRKRAKRAGVSLRSDSLLSDHFVEVRGQGADTERLSTERQETARH